MIYCWTKMLYPPSRQFNVVQSKTITLGMLALAVLLTVSGLPVPAFLSGAVHGVAAPLWHVKETIQTTREETSSRTKEVSSLYAELDMLRTELATLRRENYAARTVARDIDIVRQSIGAPEETEGRITSAVMLDLRGKPLDALILDKGVDDGVRDRMLVMSPEGISMGYIERAYSRSAHVRLFSSAGVTTNVVLYGSTTLQAMLEGQGSGTMSMHTPKDLPLVPGTIIGLPNMEGSMVGEVVAVEASPEDAFQTAYVRSPINQYELRYLLIDTTTMWEPGMESTETEEKEDEE